MYHRYGLSDGTLVYFEELSVTPHPGPVASKAHHHLLPAHTCADLGIWLFLPMFSLEGLGVPLHASPSPSYRTAQPLSGTGL